MRILFIRLPAPDPSRQSLREAVPLSAARAAALAEARGILAREDWSFLDRDTAEYGGDAAVTVAAAETGASAVLFELEPHNLDRSAWIAKKLRARSPRTILAAHGPEARRDMPIFRASTFDAILEGETEEAFCAFLADLRGGSISPHYLAEPSPDIGSWPDPYLSGVLAVEQDRPVYIETVLGCPAPCLEGPDTGSGLRFRPDGQAAKIIRLASKRGAPEIRFQDRALSLRQDLPGFFRDAAGANDAGVPMELNLDPGIVTEDLAGLMADAAVETVRTGPWSTNPAALAALGSSWNREGFERGCGILTSLGIRVRPTLLLGLPFDDYDAVIDSFDFLGMAGLGQDALVSPLAVLPGTRIRDRAEDLGIKEYLRRPPYYVMETEWIDEDGIADAAAAFEESFDVALAPPVAPSFDETMRGFRIFADLRKSGSLDKLLVNPETLGSSLTLLLSGDDEEGIQRLARAARDLRKENPFGLYQIVLYSDKRIPGEAVQRRIADAFIEPDHWYELSRIYSLDPQRSFQTRVFFATRKPSLALAALRDAQDLETIFVLDAEPARGWERVFDALPFLAFDRDSVPFGLLYDAMNAYRAYPDLLIEAKAEVW